MRRWRSRLGDELTAAGVPSVQDLRSAPVVERLAMHHAGAECPASVLIVDTGRFDSEGNFIEAVFTATREVALVALMNRPAGMAPADMVDRTLAEPGTLREGVRSWLLQLDAPGVAVLRAAAVSWIVDARALGARRGEPQWHAPSPLRHQPGSVGVSLTATVDALHPSAGGPHLLVMRSRSTGADARVAARVALLWALVCGQAASSVTLGFRDTLERVRTSIDDDLLGSAIGEAVEDIAQAQRPSIAPRHPGRHCRWCTIAAGCRPGARWLSANRSYPFATS